MVAGWASIALRHQSVADSEPTAPGPSRCLTEAIETCSVHSFTFRNLGPALEMLLGKFDVQRITPTFQSFRLHYSSEGVGLQNERHIPRGSHPAEEHAHPGLTPVRGERLRVDLVTETHEDLSKVGSTKERASVQEGKRAMVSAVSNSIHSWSCPMLRVSQITRSAYSFKAILCTAW